MRRGETRFSENTGGRECPTATATATVTASATTRRGPFKQHIQHIQHIQIERTMPITIMPLIMWDNKTKRAPVIQTVAIERMCHQIAVGCVLTETRLNSTEWPNGPQAATAANGDGSDDVGSSVLPVELPRHTQQQRQRQRQPARRSSQNREAKQQNE